MNILKTKYAWKIREIFQGKELITSKSLNYFSVIGAVSIFLFTVISCNPEEWQTVDCSECYTEKPEFAEINVKLSISNLNPSVVVRVYSGRFEEEKLILSDTTNNETWTAILPADEYYSITATYKSQNNYFNVTAIDGGMVRTQRIRGTCDEPCWVTKGNNFNLKLKY
jgi:hypothetical protein